MKYAIFAITVMGILPLTAILVIWRKSMHLALLGLIFPIMLFNQTAINFFSHEWYTGTSRGMEVSLSYLIALAILVAVALRRGFLNPFPDIGSCIYLLYFIMSFLAFKNAENRLFSFFELWKMFMMHLVFMGVYYCLKEEKCFRTIFMTAFGILTVIAFVMSARSHYAGKWQVTAFFPHQNSMAMYMTIVGTVLLAIYLTSGRKDKWWLSLLLYLMASACVIRTYSRGAMACYPIGCAITAALCLLFNFKIQKAFKLSPIVIIGMLGVLLAVPRIIQRFEGAPEQSKLTRIDLAVRAKNMMLDEPLFGVGLNNWNIKIQYPYKYVGVEGELPEEGVGPTGIVETIYLLVAAECGIPGILLLLTWLFYYWTTAFRLLFKLRGTAYFFVPAGLFGGLTSVYMQSALEWVLKQQINFMQLMICFASLAVLKDMTKKSAGKTLEAEMNRSTVLLPTHDNASESRETEEHQMTDGVLEEESALNPTDDSVPEISKDKVTS